MSASSFSSWSVIPGRIGESDSPTRRPASASRRSTSIRTSGGGAHGSIRRSSSASSELSETWTERRRARGSREQVQVAQNDRAFVVMPSRRPRTCTAHSRKRRVTRSSLSPGW
jgi:hypothetical protein